jgi:hypothetical protein
MLNAVPEEETNLAGVHSHGNRDDDGAFREPETFSGAGIDPGQRANGLKLLDSLTEQRGIVFTIPHCRPLSFPFFPALSVVGYEDSVQPSFQDGHNGSINVKGFLYQRVTVIPQCSGSIECPGACGKGSPTLRRRGAEKTTGL